MALKIIKEEPDASVVEQIICQNCGITIEYVPDDIKELFRGTCYPNEMCGEDGFKCPKCSKNVVVRSW